MTPSSATAAAGIVARNFLTLGSGEVIARGIAFAASAYVARYLGVEAYGVVQVAAAVVLWCACIADCGAGAGLGVREIAARRDELGQLAPALLTVRILVAGALALLLAFVGLALLPAPEGPILAVSGLGLLAVGASSRWTHLGMERTRLVAVSRCASELAIALALVWLVHGPADVMKVPAIRFAGDLLAALVLLGALRRGGVRLTPRLDWNLLRPLMRRAAPLVGTGLLGLLIFNGDLVLLRVFRSSAEVGLYAAAYALVGFSSNLALTYGVSLLPTLTRAAGEPDRERELYRTSNAYALALGLPLALGGCVLAGPLIELVFGEAYAPASRALQILVWAIPLGLLRNLASTVMVARARETFLLRVTVAAAAANLTLNLLLIPAHGLVGAAVAAVLTEAIRMSLLLALARREGFPLLMPASCWRPVTAGLSMTAFLLFAGPLGPLVAVPLGGGWYFLSLLALGGLRLRGRRLPLLRV